MTHPDLVPALRDLGPAAVLSRRAQRYKGGGMHVRLTDLAPADRAVARGIYEAVKHVYLAWRDTRPEVDWTGLWAHLRALGNPGFMERVSSLGSATADRTPTQARGRAIHDVRGGALTPLILEVAMQEGIPAPSRLQALVHLCRDHAKIMRNALVDLDPEVRAADETERAHGIDDIVDKWSDAPYPVDGSDVRVRVHCEYRGGMASCCLEASAVDRVLYNLVNNAARFTADHTVGLTILPHPVSSIRFVVTNALGAGEERWIRDHAGDLATLFAPGTTHGGEGLGLANCASFVTAAYGLATPDEAVEAGFVGATIESGRFLAWFHWPRFSRGR